MYDCPDNSSPMKRRQAKVIADLMHLKGFLFAPFHCCAHSVHRTILQSCDHTQMLGDVHAVAFVSSLPSHQSALQKALWDYLATALKARRIEATQTVSIARVCVHGVKLLALTMTVNCFASSLYEYQAGHVSACLSLQSSMRASELRCLRPLSRRYPTTRPSRSGRRTLPPSSPTPCVAQPTTFVVASSTVRRHGQLPGQEEAVGPSSARLRLRW